MAHERQPYAAALGVLIGQDAQDLALAQDAEHRPDALPRQYLRHRGLPGAVDDVRSILVIGVTRDDREVIAHPANRGRQELPVAEVPGDDYNPPAPLNSLPKVLLVPNVHEIAELILREPPRLEQLQHRLRHVPDREADDTLALSAVVAVTEDAREVSQRDLAARPEEPEE